MSELQSVQNTLLNMEQTYGNMAVSLQNIATDLALIAGSTAFVQEQTAVNTAYASTSVAVPYDASIPQINEGGPLVSVTITPSAVTNRLVIEGLAYLSVSAAGPMAVAMFQGSGANALETGVANANTADVILPVPIRHEMQAATTQSVSFSLRAGPSTTSTTMFFNGISTGPKYGGTLKASIAVTEIKV